MFKKKIRIEKPVLIRLFDNLFREIERLQKQIGELTVALRENECLTHEQAMKIINMMTPEEEPKT